MVAVEGATRSGSSVVAGSPDDLALAYEADPKAGNEVTPHTGRG
jgi:hypothetical protein